jgi:hypothetical protein
MLRSCPAGLTRVTARRLGEAEERSWLVAAVEAEDVVLDEWGELHDALQRADRLCDERGQGGAGGLAGD